MRRIDRRPGVVQTPPLHLRTSLERRFVVIALGLTAAELLAIPSWSHETRKGKIIVEHSWARASMQKSGAVYMIIRNQGAVTERLLAVETSVARHTELQGRAATTGRAAQTQPVRTLVIPARGEIRLSPTGAQVTLDGLEEQLLEGTTFLATLVFEHAGAIDVEVEVVADTSNSTQ
jgi:copper(I)-binding protein